MDRLFLDANVLFAAAYREDAGVQRLWRLDDARLITSAYAVEEARRNLRLPDQLSRLEGLLPALEEVVSAPLGAEHRAGVYLPIEDLPILGAAVAGGASHLITGDVRSFGAYFGAHLAGVLVTTPADYLKSTGREGRTVLDGNPEPVGGAERTR